MSDVAIAFYYKFTRIVSLNYCKDLKKSNLKIYAQFLCKNLTLSILIIFTISTCFKVKNNLDFDYKFFKFCIKNLRQITWF